MFIDVDGARIFATSGGPSEAPAVLAVGGWIGSWELWTDPLGLLSDRFRTLAFDHRGTGATVADVASITLDRLVDDVIAVLDHFGVERCTVAAESMGAMTAVLAALRHPGRVEKLVLVDGMLDPGSGPLYDRFLGGLRAAYPQTLDRFVELCVPEPDGDAIKRWGRQILERASQESAIALRQLGAGQDLVGRLPEVQQPTLLLHGEKDVLVPLAAAEAHAARLPDARLVVLPGAGHVPTLTRPREVADAMRAFLGGSA